MQASRLIIVLGFLMLGLLALPASAEIYKWTDKSGGIHYTETPPPDAQYQTVKPKNTEPGDPSAPQQLEDQVQHQAAEQDVTNLEDQKAAQEAGQQEARRMNCEISKNALEELQTRPYHAATKDQNGDYVKMTPEQYDAQVDKMNKQIAQYCQ